MDAIPRFDADEGRMLAGGTPDAQGRCLTVDGDDSLVVVIEDLDMSDLAAVEDQRVIAEHILREDPDAVVGLYGVIAFDDTAMVIAIEALGAWIVDAQSSAQWLSLAGSGNEEGGMATDLEEDGLAVGILHMPYDMDLVAFQTIGDGEVEMVGIDLEGLLAVGEGESDAVGGLAYYLEVGVAGEAMAGEMIFLSVYAVGILPQSTDEREENRRVAVPIVFVTIPEIFLTFGVADTLQFCTMFTDGQRQCVVVDLFHCICILVNVLPF